MNKKTYISPAIKVRKIVHLPLLTDSLTQGIGDNPTEAEAKRSGFMPFVGFEGENESSEDYDFFR